MYTSHLCSRIIRDLLYKQFGISHLQSYLYLRGWSGYLLTTVLVIVTLVGFLFFFTLF